ncbi:hypothetical protein BDW62DRAFT_191378 [Aspergillus aurantiobrunneus]
MLCPIGEWSWRRRFTSLLIGLSRPASRADAMAPRVPKPKGESRLHLYPYARTFGSRFTVEGHPRTVITGRNVSRRYTSRENDLS